MTSPRFQILVIFGLWFLTALPPGFSATPVFRWYDENGKVFYSDQVPPKHSKYGRSQINQRGKTVNVVEAAKSKDQLDWWNKIRTLRKQAKSLLAAQLKHDRVLLRTFRDVKEIHGNLAGKLSTVDVLVNINNSNIQQLQAQLDKQERRAAQIETNGRKVPRKLLAEINTTRKRIYERRDRIKSQEQEKQRITEKYEKDINRFNDLSNQYKNGKKTLRLVWPHKDPGNKDLTTGISIFRCYKKHICDTAWELAVAYVQQKATTDISVSTDKIVYTFDPRGDQDISLSVSKISGENKIQNELFLDIRCKRSVFGNELCLSEQVQNIRDDFRPYLESQLRIGVVRK